MSYQKALTCNFCPTIVAYCKFTGIAYNSEIVCPACKVKDDERRVAFEKKTS